MRQGLAIVMIVCAVLAIAVSVGAQYQRATKYTYSYPRIAQYPNQGCTMVSPIQDSPSCYNDGVVQCSARNTAGCYWWCVRSVQNVCWNDKQIPHPLCQFPLKFISDFRNEEACQRAVVDQCSQELCADKFSACRSRGYTTCSNIGRIYV